MAGVVALAVEKSGGRFGNINPMIYELSLLQTLFGGEHAPPAAQGTVGRGLRPLSRSSSSGIDPRNLVIGFLQPGAQALPLEYTQLRA
jgi:hypothetical protein